MRGPRRAFRDIFDNPVLVGTVTILVVIVAVFVSYIAENGLPFVPTYDLSIEVADGGELNKNADVRIGGARVGQVLTITPEPANRQYPRPYARLKLAIDKSLEPLPADTTYQVRLASVLGGQYVELFPGKARPGVGSIPDGGVLTISAKATANHNIPYVDLSQAFDVFGPRTQQGIRSVATGLGEAFAGRGVQLNDATVAFAHLLGPAQRVLDLFAAPQTNLAGFIDGLAETTAAIAPDAGTLTSLLGNVATTSRALDVPALGTTLDELPAFETTGTAVLNRATPVLDQLASISRQLRPAAGYLPTAASSLDTVLRSAGPTLKLLSPVSSGLETALTAATRLSTDPAATESFQVLGKDDLGTAGSSAFLGLGAILNTVSAAQFGCDAAVLWVRNFASVLSEGNSTGNWLRIATLVDPDQLSQSTTGTPSPDLHVDFDPKEGNGDCQVGNEVYSGATNIDDPVTDSNKVPTTTPPTGVYQEGVNAGLVPADAAANP